MNNILTIKERILQLAKYKDFTIMDFCEKVDISYSNFRGKAKETPINSTTIANIFALIPDLNLEWLLTGEGSMLKSGSEPVAPTVAQRIADLEALVASQRETIEVLKKMNKL